MVNTLSLLIGIGFIVFGLLDYFASRRMVKQCDAMLALGRKLLEFDINGGPEIIAGMEMNLRAMKQGYYLDGLAIAVGIGLTILGLLY